MEIAEDLISGIFGPETLEGHKARDVDELFRHAGARAAERAEAEARGPKRAAGQARAGRAQGKAERKAQAAREASQSVRDIYRRLASALHPDREMDPTERERKTALMQRANQAYEHDDLL